MAMEARVIPAAGRPRFNRIRGGSTASSGPAVRTPALILLLLLVAYPFCMAVYFSLSNAFIGRPTARGAPELHQPLAERRLPPDLPECLRLPGAAVFKLVMGISLALC
jgi:ABC-type sugar transport system permease subunit